VVAVAHKQFIEYTAETYSQLSNAKEVVIDIKNIVPNPTWRL
jgi:UDP-N-acetyl-D-galactosamine dehydrogenase